MPVRTAARFLLIFPGIALLLAGLFLDFDTAASLTVQADVTPVGTRDRLAEPTLPSSPSQADHGSQVYWLSCLPCHGDLGQGLTDEFRQTYPPEDRNCWTSGCHGKRPYANGFTLPATIPALIGPGTLQKFPNAAVLRAFIKTAMPFWKPGSLTDEDAWAVTAFLLRQNGLWNDRVDLNASNAEQVRVGSPASESTLTPAPVKNPPGGLSLGLPLAAILLLLFVGFWWFRRSKKIPPAS